MFRPSRAILFAACVLPLWLSLCVVIPGAVSSAASTADGLSAPAGYTAQQLIFDDQFSGASLDTTKWNTYMGAQGGVWNNEGTLPLAYSGPNVPGSGTDAEMYGPSEVSVGNGLTLSAQRNTNEYSGTYPWISGVVTTEGKFTLPTTGWYVQAKIKMPDMTQGLWPNMWFLPAAPGPFNELDFVQGGFYGGPSDVNEAPIAAGYFDTAGTLINEGVPNVGFDASAGYHTYGIEWRPGIGINEYVDGNLVWSITQSQVPGGIVAEGYELILNMQVAASADSGWRTVPASTSPGGSMEVAEVQAYSLSSAPGSVTTPTTMPANITPATSPSTLGPSACVGADEPGVVPAAPCRTGGSYAGVVLPAAATPEAPLVVLFPVVALGLVGGVVFHRRRRPQRV